MITMDHDISILHVVQPGKLKPQKSIVVQLSEQFNKRKLTRLDDLSTSTNSDTVNTNLCMSGHPTNSSDKTLTSNSIDEIWLQRTKENPKLYNATKFRVYSIISTQSQTQEKDNDKVLMCLGVTDYKEYLGTNWAETVSELQTKGLALHDNPQSFLSDALGVGAFLLTDDNYIVFLRRSEFCAEAPCTWDIPGGHAEPKELIGNIPLHQIKVTEMNEELVAAEIFQSIMREVTDEVNVTPNHLEEPLYMGTVRNKTSGGRPSLEFFIQCHLESREVKRLYEQGNQLEADESTNIKFVPLDEINSLAKCDTRDDTDLWKNLAPSAKGCLILYWLSHQII